jgi:hypothetical protein
MNGLNTIARLNADATERNIPARTAAGKYVVAEYSGLHFTSYTEWDTEVAANAFACKVGSEVGKRAKVYHPTGLRVVGPPGPLRQGQEARQQATDALVFDARRTPDGDSAVGQPMATGSGGDFGGGGADASYGGTESE